MAVETLGRLAPGDGGEGVWRYDAGLTVRTFTADCSLANGADPDGYHSEVTIAASAYAAEPGAVLPDLSGYLVTTAGGATGVYVVRQLDRGSGGTVLFLGAPLGVAGASVSLTFDPDNGGTVLRTPTGGSWRRQAATRGVKLRWWARPTQGLKDPIYDRLVTLDADRDLGPDTTVAFRAALAASSGRLFWGGGVEVDPGIYRIDGRVRVPKSGTGLRCDTPRGATICGATSGAGLDLVAPGVSGAWAQEADFRYEQHLRGIVLDGLGVALNMLLADSVEEPGVADINVYNCTDANIILRGSRIGRLINIGSSGAPTLIRVDGRGNTVAALELVHCNLYAAGVASIEVMGQVEGVRVRGGWIEDAGAVVYVATGGETTAVEVVLSQVTITQSTRVGFTSVAAADRRVVRAVYDDNDVQMLASVKFIDCTFTSGAMTHLFTLALDEARDGQPVGLTVESIRPIMQTYPTASFAASADAGMLLLWDDAERVNLDAVTLVSGAARVRGRGYSAARGYHDLVPPTQVEWNAGTWSVGFGGGAITSQQAVARSVGAGLVDAVYRLGVTTTGGLQYYDLTPTAGYRVAGVSVGSIDGITGSGALCGVVLSDEVGDPWYSAPRGLRIHLTPTTTNAHNVEVHVRYAVIP